MIQYFFARTIDNIWLEFERLKIPKSANIDTNFSIQQVSDGYNIHHWFDQEFPMSLENFKLKLKEINEIS